MEKLSVGIGADVSDLKKGITEAVIALEKLRQQKSANLKVGLDVSALNTQIATAKTNLAGLQKQVSSTSTSMGGFTKSTANGSNALMQFSRIAQDAPYGIIGIGNNITATAESFSYLKQQTGSTGGALKALASSLMGTGGILLGISLLTTGLTLLSQSGLSVGDIIDKITGKFDEFGGAIKKASEEAVKSTAGEIFGLKALVSASQNKALSDKERLLAVEDLQKQYPGYFGNLSKEQIMTSNLTGVVNELTKSLLNRAIAEKLASASADIQLKVFAANAQLVKQKAITKEISDETQRLVKEAKANGSSQEYINSLYKGGRDAIADTLQAEKEIRSEILSGTKALERRQNVINTLTASSIKLSESTGGKVKAAPKVFETPQVTALQSFITPLELTPIIDVSKVRTSMKLISGIISEESVRAQEALLSFNENASNIINDSIASTFENLGAIIGNTMASGGNILEAAGKSLLSSLGSVLVELGKMAIKTGVGILAIKIALKSLNPYVAIAAGVALVALGSAVSSSIKGLGDSGGGGGSTSMATGSTANNTSTTSGGTGWSGGMNGTVVFEIAGTSLIGVLNNTTERNLRIGGR